MLLSTGRKQEEEEERGNAKKVESPRKREVGQELGGNAGRKQRRIRKDLRDLKASASRLYRKETPRVKE